MLFSPCSMDCAGATSPLTKLRTPPLWARYTKSEPLGCVKELRPMNSSKDDSSSAPMALQSKALLYSCSSRRS